MNTNPKQVTSHIETTKHCCLHKQVETLLLCTDCTRSFCWRCLHRLPIGQICSDCYQKRQKTWMHKWVVAQQAHAALKSLLRRKVSI